MSRRGAPRDGGKHGDFNGSAPDVNLCLLRISIAEDRRVRFVQGMKHHVFALILTIATECNASKKEGTFYRFAITALLLGVNIAIEARLFAPLKPGFM